MSEWSKILSWVKESKIKLLVVIFGFLISGSAMAQRDTAFWFAAPDMTSGHGDQPLYFRITAFGQATQVKLSIPANPSFIPIVKNVAANKSLTIDMSSYKSIIENDIPDSVLNRGIYIQSTNPITVYYEEASGYNPDLFTLKGSNALGLEFYIPAQDTFNNGSSYTPTPYSSFDFVATQDNTIITITTTNNVVGHNKNVAFTKILNKGQTYSARATSYSRLYHLGGSHVVSNKPIAITVKDDSQGTPGGCFDLAGDQIVPITILGTEYVVVKGFLNFADFIYVWATENNTQVYLNGSTTPTATINAGERYRFQLSSSSVYIKTSKPAYILHITGFGCEIGEAILPPITCTGSNEMAFVRTTNEYFGVIIITQNSAKNNFKLNGSTSSAISGSNFSAVPGTGGQIVAASINLSSVVGVGNGNVIENTSDLFHLGLINGGSSSGCRYGYFSGFSTLYLGSDALICSADSLTLDAGDFKDSYLWNTNDTTRTITIGNSDTFWVQTVQNQCTLIDSIIVTALPSPIADFSIFDTNQCVTDSFYFFDNSSVPVGDLRYKWNFGDTNSSKDKNPVYRYYEGDTFKVKMFAISDDGCRDSLSKTVVVHPIAKTYIGVNIKSQCFENHEFQFYDSSSIKSGNYSRIWYFGDGDTSSFENPTHTYSNSGNYNVKLVTFSNKGCLDSSNIVVSVNPMPMADFSINLDEQCLNGNSFVFTNNSSPSGLNYLWDFGDTSSSSIANPIKTFAITDSFNVQLKVATNKGCEDSISKEIIVRPMPNPIIFIEDSVFCGSDLNLFMDSSSISYGIMTSYWDLGDGSTSVSDSFYHGYLNPGLKDIKLINTSNFGCKDSIETEIRVVDFSLDFSIDNDTQCFENNSFNFSSLLSNPNSESITLNWNFGDTSFSSISNPNHSYNYFGSFGVKLNASLDNSIQSCYREVTKSLFVAPEPMANLGLSNSIQCFNGNEFLFYDSSTIASGSLSRLWYFGDNDSSLVKNPSHSYSTTGSYNVDLVSISNFNCTDTFTTQIIIHPNPQVNFLTNDSIQCFDGHSFGFTNLSNISSGSLSHLWYLNDSIIATNSQITNFQLEEADTFLIKLIELSNYSCADSMIDTIVLHPSPIASYLVNDSSQCLYGNDFDFSNFTTIKSGVMNHYWYLDDSLFSVALDFNNLNISIPDTYQVKLLSISNHNCSDSITGNIYIHPMPKVNFLTNDSVQCFNGHNFSFNNTSNISSGTITPNWFVNNFTTSSNQHFTNQIFATADTYFIKLLEVSDNFCADSLIDTIFLHPSPVMGFLVNDSDQCLMGNQFNFTNQTSIKTGLMDHYWFVDDSLFTDNLDFNNFSVQNPDTFKIKLVSISNLFCSDSLEKQVFVFPMPIADFQINDSSQCFIGHNFIFTNLSTIDLNSSGGSQSNSLSYLWDFGDTTFSSNQNDSHIYNFNNQYQVKLKVNSVVGCMDSMTKTITVEYLPNSDFEVVDSAQCRFGNIFSFINKSSVPFSNLIYEWDFSDLGTSQVKDPFHSYQTADTFNVQLIAITSGDCKDTTFKKVIVFPMPVAKFNNWDSSQCFENNAFLFQNQSTISSGFMSFMWDFGDGDTSSLSSPVHSFNYPDTFDIKLLATSDQNCKDSSYGKTYIHIHPEPIADFSFKDKFQCLNTNFYNFYNQSQIQSGSFSSQWFFDDGDSISLYDASHKFLNHDTFSVKLIVISDWSCKDSALYDVVVHPLPLVKIGINDENQCLSDNYFEFNDLTTIKHGTLKSQQWFFGDGTNSSIQNPNHSYAYFDTFQIIHIVESDSSCFDTLIDFIAVHQIPQANFNIKDADQCLAGNDFEFTDISSPYAVTYHAYWDFGDSNIDTGFIVNHSYSNHDTFKVRLLVENNLGCLDSVDKNIIVFPMPKVDYMINDSDQCLSLNKFYFQNLTNISSGSLIYDWFVDDSLIGSQKDVSNFKLLIPDTFDLKLISTSLFSCKDSITKQFIIFPDPVSDFKINDSDQCLSGNSFDFKNLSKIKSGTLDHFWYLNDTLKVNSLDYNGLNLKYASTYQIKLLSISDNICLDSMTKPITVHPMPKATFSFNHPCLDDTTYFYDHSTVKPPYQIANWHYDFNDGNNSKIQNPEHIYLNSNIYKVKLLVESNTGCLDSIYKNVSIEQHVLPPLLERATVYDNEEILLDWVNSGQGRPMEIILERANEFQNFKLIENLNNTSTYYYDVNVDPSSISYVYRLAIVDSCNYQSPYSNYGKTILLRKDTSGQYPKIYWTHYKDWADGIDHYEVEIYNPEIKDFELLSIVNPSDSLFKDSLSNFNSAEYCYRVKALRNNVLLESISNYVCFETPFRIWVPNAFTPNGDGTNELFEIEGQFIISFNIEIYDRWGIKIFESNDINQSWDGMYEGNQCPPGVYIYQVFAKGTGAQKKLLSGNVTLLR